jgi:hypothetical protein
MDAGMVRHGGRLRGGDGAVRSPMAAVRGRCGSQDNLGYQEENDCEVQKPGETK